MTSRARLLIALVGAGLLAASLVGVSRLGAREPEQPAATSPVSSLFDGIPQDGLALGRNDAPVTLVEYADLQCPFCAEWSLRTLPTLVSDYVRTGKLRIVFRGLAFIGPDSDEALRTTVAAGRHDRLWQVLDGLYQGQGAENSGWVTDELVDRIAAEAGLDAGELRDRRDDASVDRELAQSSAAAQAAGVHGTPAFQLGLTGGKLELVVLRSLGPEGIRPAIDALLNG